MRVQFPDDYILETDFHPSEKIQSLVDLLIKVVVRPDLPFYLCKYHGNLFFSHQGMDIYHAIAFRELILVPSLCS